MTVKNRKKGKNKNDSNKNENNNKSKNNKNKRNDDDNNGKNKKNKEGKGKWYHYLFDEIDNSTLIFFRILWGLIMVYECYTFSKNDYRKAKGYYTTPEWHPTYYLMGWVEAYSDHFYIKIHILTMAVAGTCVTIGLFYKVACAVFFVGFSYLVFVDAALYLNHFYLIQVFAFMLIFLPCNADLSVDSLLFPKIRSTTMPRWILWVIRFEQTLVYFYAGVAKCNVDWLRGEPLRHWVYGKNFDNPLLTELISTEWAPYFLSYGGLMFDLFVGFGLLFPRGVIFYISLASCIFFHASNKIVFSIGIFPYVMFASTTLYFEPDWIRRWLPMVFSPPKKNKKKATSLTLTDKLVLTIMILFAAHQILAPLRHHTYPGDVAWNEYGHKYSWRMKLRDKRCETMIWAVDRNTNEKMIIDMEAELYGKQSRKIKPRPELMIQFGQHMSQVLKKRGNFDHEPAISIEQWCSLNYRDWQLMINPEIDVTTIDAYDWPHPEGYLVPLQPLKEEFSRGLPWNWEWNFNWLKDPFKRATMSDEEYRNYHGFNPTMQFIEGQRKLRDHHDKLRSFKQNRMRK